MAGSPHLSLLISSVSNGTWIGLLPRAVRPHTTERSILGENIKPRPFVSQAPIEPSGLAVRSKFKFYGCHYDRKRRRKKEKKKAKETEKKEETLVSVLIFLVVIIKI